MTPSPHAALKRHGLILFILLSNAAWAQRLVEAGVGLRWIALLDFITGMAVGGIIFRRRNDH